MPGRDAPDSKARLTGAVAFWALAGAALFVAHDAILVVQARPGGAIGVVLGGIIGAWRLVG